MRMRPIIMMLPLRRFWSRNSLREIPGLVRSRALDRRALIGFMRIIAIDSRSRSIKATAPMAAVEALGFSVLT